MCRRLGVTLSRPMIRAEGNRPGRGSRKVAVRQVSGTAMALAAASGRGPVRAAEPHPRMDITAADGPAQGQGAVLPARECGPFGAAGGRVRSVRARRAGRR